MPLPSVTFRSELNHIVRKELDQHDGELSEYLLTEHTDDGRHNRITAKSIKVDGPIIVTGGPITVDGVPVGGVPAPTPPLAHHVSHETGGSDPIVALSGAVITTGTVADARLSSNVALKNINNSFSVGQTVTGNIGISGGYFERSRGVAMGEWQAMPYSAADYGATGSMTWTVPSGNIYTNTYTLIGKTLFWHFFLIGSTIGGTASTALRIRPPVTPAYKHMPHRASSFIVNGTPIEAELTIYDTSLMQIARVDGANLPLGSLQLHFSIFIEIA